MTLPNDPMNATTGKETYYLGQQRSINTKLDYSAIRRELARQCRELAQSIPMNQVAASASAIGAISKQLACIAEMLALEDNSG